VKTGLAPIERMFGVALDVNRATLARLDQHWVRDFTFLESAGVVSPRQERSLPASWCRNHGCTTARQLAARAVAKAAEAPSSARKRRRDTAIAFAVGVEQGR